jgi:hypothetical protein
VFVDPAVRADFKDVKEAFDESLASMGLGGRLLKKFLPDVDPVLYVPVGAACGVALPFRLRSVTVVEDSGLAFEGEAVLGTDRGKKRERNGLGTGTGADGGPGVGGLGLPAWGKSAKMKL